MNVTCTTAELPNLLPMLAKIQQAFHLVVLPADDAAPNPIPTTATTATVASKPAHPVLSVKRNVKQAAPARAPSKPKARWYTTEEVRTLLNYSSAVGVAGFMKRAGIAPIKVSLSGHRGRTPFYYDAEQVDAIKRQYDNTYTAKEAAAMMGDKSVIPIKYHTEHRRITTTIVAGQVRYKKDDIVALMRYRKIA